MNGIRSHETDFTLVLEQFCNDFFARKIDRCLVSPKALAIDPKQIDPVLTVTLATGGLVHPSTPGHSPSLRIQPDNHIAWATLAQAGFMHGRGYEEIDLA